MILDPVTVHKDCNLCEADMTVYVCYDTQLIYMCAKCGCEHILIRHRSREIVKFCEGPQTE